MHVLVTTHTRGVFFGVLDEDNSPGDVTLLDAQNAVHWTSGTRGWMALAADGPDADCRIGPKVPSLRLFGVSAVVECTPEAVAAWKAEPWRSSPGQ
jgi:hypothetical protein